MTEFDVQAILWLNQYSQIDPIIDGLIVVITRYHLLRGVVIVSMLWWAWTGARTRLITEDLVLVRSVLGVFVAIALARGLQNMLPARARPAHDPAIDFELPSGYVGADALVDWSSFPSDHAVLIMALVVAVLYLNRFIGILALVWGIFIILLPRMYLGLHYPSDIVGGVVLGTAIMVTAQRISLPRWLAPALTQLEDRHRGLAYAGFFVFSYLCATMFSDVREFLRLLGQFVEMVSL